MRKVNGLWLVLPMLLLAACGGGGGGSGGSGGSSTAPRGIVALAENMIATATADEAKPWDVDTLATVTTSEDEEAADI